MSVPDAALMQAPVPLQTSHGEHSVSGSVPTAWKLQIPTLLVWSQERHVPLQSTLQQTPSEQTPDRQVEPSEHGSPSGEGV